MKNILLIALILSSFFAKSATPVFCCGFECGLNDSHFTILSGTPTYETGIKRSGSRALRINPTSSQEYVQLVSSLTGNTVIVIRGYVYFVTLPNTTCSILISNVDGLGAWFNSSDNKIYAGYTTGPTLGSTGVSVTTGQWYRIDVKVDVSSNPQLADVKVDGTDCGQASRAVAGGSIFNIVIGHATFNTTSDVYFDDIIISQTSGDYPLGAGYVNHFHPTSDGTHNIAGANNWERSLTGTDILNSTTDAYLLVQDIPLPSSLSTFINSVAPSASGYVECVFGPAPGISAPSSAPQAVEFVGLLQTASAGGSPTMDISLRINDNGTTGDVFTSTSFYQPTSPIAVRAHFAIPPTGGTWNVSGGNGNFNNLRVRFGSFDAGDSNPDGFLGPVMIEADFAGDPPTPPATNNNLLLLMGIGMNDKKHSYENK